jgi:hypothetical protein
MWEVSGSITAGYPQGKHSGGIEIPCYDVVVSSGKIFEIFVV